jgi:hypothetical protein
MLPTTRKNLRGKKAEIGAEYPLAISLALTEELGGSRQAIKKLAKRRARPERATSSGAGEAFSGGSLCLPVDDGTG